MGPRPQIHGHTPHLKVQVHFISKLVGEMIDLQPNISDGMVKVDCFVTISDKNRDNETQSCLQCVFLHARLTTT